MFFALNIITGVWIHLTPFVNYFRVWEHKFCCSFGNCPVVCEIPLSCNLIYICCVEFLGTQEGIFSVTYIITVIRLP